MKIASYISVILSFYSSFSQSLTLEALHFTSDNVLVRIERKYQTKSENNIYVTHTNFRSLFLQDSLVKKGDTTIVVETLFEIPRTNQEDKLTSLDGYAVTSYDSINNTMTLSVFNDESIDTENRYLGDTILPIDFDTETFIHDLQKSRLRKIHAGLINVPLDSLIYKEAIKLQTINNVPIQIDFYDSGGILHLSKYCSIDSNSVICKSKFMDDTTRYYQVDSINFNADTTHVQWKTSSLRWGTTYHTDYHIYDNRMVICGKDTIEYIQENFTFINLITENLIYSDFPYHFSLKFDFDRQKVTKVKFHRNDLEVINYEYDQEGEILRKNIFVNDQLTKYIKYQKKNTATKSK